MSTEVQKAAETSSAVTTTDASNKRQQQPDSTSSTSTLATTVTANGNFDLSYALSWKPCQGDSLNLPDHRFRRHDASLISFQRSRIHKPHAHTQAFKVNRSNIKIVDSNLPHYQRASKSNKESSTGEIMIQVKEMMQDNDLKNSKSKDKGSRSRSQSMNEQSHYKQDKTKTRQSINVKSHIFNVIDGTEEFEERDLNIGGDYNGTQFASRHCEFYDNVGISHQTFVARTPQQNGVAEAINTTCYTQNRSLIRIRYNKTPYELMQDKKPDLSFFHVFGALCYPTNDNDDLGKLDEKDDIGIFVGYAPAKKAFRIYNKRTWKIIETIQVTFDELTAMASEQSNSGPRLHSMTPGTSSSGLISNPDNPSHVYKIKKAIYSLKPAPRAWYDMLSSFLLSQHFSKGAVDPTLFTRQAGNDLLLMSFFLGLQIFQSPRGIFINQSKYASEIVKKYGLHTTDSVDTPLLEKSKMDEDLQGKQIDATLYHGMIRSLMYLTSSRLDLIYAVCLCA
ncbi:uncharacterized mitochondrial protein-like protein [Tanacetum coccineum]|uniref:Uncharacterized mitochondrial protein-like protein n=1 Tax=Tanacetum coccineum TaxID=301880 RepID=A0ABQ4Z3Z8_9ASTR